MNCFTLFRRRVRTGPDAAFGGFSLAVLAVLLVGAAGLVGGCAGGPERAPRQPVSGVDRPAKPPRDLKAPAPEVDRTREESEDDEVPEKS
jgi:hypothetical protein